MKSKHLILISILLLVFDCKKKSNDDTTTALILAAILSSSSCSSGDFLNDPCEQFSGGDTTTFDSTESAFDLEAANVSDSRRSIDFQDGNANFNRTWLPAGNSSVTGLGPVFNNRSCQGCHVKDGRGRPPADGTTLSSMLIRLSAAGSNPTTGGPVAMTNFGTQLNTEGILEYGTGTQIPKEGTVTITYTEEAGSFPDGETYSLRKPSYAITWNVGGGATQINVANPGQPYHPTNNPSGTFYISPRTAPIVPGLGLLEAIPESTIRSFADVSDSNGDGISGKPNLVWDTTQAKAFIGRFGWKANQPNLNHQNASAFLGDIGLTTSVFPSENCATGQTLCLASPTGNGSNPEISNDRLSRVTFYTSLVSVPGRRNWKNEDVKKGKELFIEIGCSSCHIPRIKTGDHSIKEVANQEIRPYTDLLLHDMGDGLSDSRSDFLATGNEWRTTPLWGLGLIERVNGHEFLLHDGRARGVQEAILWHGGEAEQSKNKYKQLPKESRTKMISFLKSL
ncbi:thiol oxidoreductase [Leptospira sp. 2 VSF19]|uniref:Thiol oxidoreductase n=1 Tax=Leptospira soteropolitanensis TaxID=2950025 RepID=A0AAW5VCM3_9LEPT|nr:di-heme oxidoredictase family protein [Leptospira soteropolitanensis]MCW7493018.1 thiol oxidoreductase [Leptospira soteropolitanensis]MCW7500253.1 thiol oxidoreductase [Leptospira soteropolitanensis]MCW7522504.1 thiol oxidoreductase [Leptospira soteropolitanensis]MCW7526360.1 thiol oxidoreductase [Leptospira soteropolitanensis]MCW7529528.1 thiol oxidoreductase [Leptospira soteropolitanensis]